MIRQSGPYIRRLNNAWVRVIWQKRIHNFVVEKFIGNIHHSRVNHCIGWPEADSFTVTNVGVQFQLWVVLTHFVVSVEIRVYSPCIGTRTYILTKFEFQTNYGLLLRFPDYYDLSKVFLILEISIVFTLCIYQFKYMRGRESTISKFEPKKFFEFFDVF